MSSISTKTPPTLSESLIPSTASVPTSASSSRDSTAHGMCTPVRFWISALTVMPKYGARITGLPMKTSSVIHAATKPARGPSPCETNVYA